MAVPVKAVAFGAVAVIGALLLFSRASKAAPPEPPPPPPPPPPVIKNDPPPPPPPGVIKGECGGPTKGIAPGVSMSLKTAQAALSQAGANKIAADGIYGDKTWEAIMNFQKAKYLPETGCIDPATETALKPYVVSSEGVAPSEPFTDQNGVPWKLWQPDIGHWQGDQVPFQVSDGSWIIGYPDESEHVVTYTKEGVKNRIRDIANGYDPA